MNELPDNHGLVLCEEGNNSCGWLWGEGRSLDRLDQVDVWLIPLTLRYIDSSWDGRIYVSGDRIVFSGNITDAADFIARYAPEGSVIIGRKAMVGNKGMLHVGDYGTAVTGDRGSAVSGWCGKSIAGSHGFARSDRYGSAEAGDNGVALVRSNGTAVSGNYGVSVAGNFGTAISGFEGDSVAGDFGTAISGFGGIVRSGHKGIIQVQMNDAFNNRTRLVTGYIGENGLRPNVPYRIDDRSGSFVEAVPEPLDKLEEV